MKKFIIILLCLVACEKKPKEDAIVETLQETNMDYFSSRSSYERNHVEEMYNKIIAEDTILANLDKKIRNERDFATQKQEKYLDFALNNQTYFDNIHTVSHSIEDTVLRKKIQNYFLKEKENYEKNISHLTKIDSQNTKLQRQINDQYVIFKLFTVYKYLKDYQKKQPPIKDLEELLEEQRKVLKEIEQNQVKY